MKLVSQGIKHASKLLSAIKNIYSNIKSCIIVNGRRSPYFSSMMGVRQGENLSPLLFSLYVNDLEQFLSNKGNTGISVEDGIEQYLKTS